MKTCGIKGLLNILSTYGSVTLYCIMFTYQGEELNHQHFLLGIASTTLLCEALLIAYVRKHKFDIIDVSIFVAYLYFIFMKSGTGIFWLELLESKDATKIIFSFALVKAT